MIFHTNLDDHFIGVRHMFDRIRQFVLTIRPAKLYVAAKEVTILGYTLKQGKIMSELFLVDNIMPILFPKAKKQVRCLLDLINCYGVLVAKYSDIFCKLR